MRETWDQSSVWEDPLEEGMATHSNILAWRIPWTEEPGGLKPMGSQRIGHNGSDLARTLGQKALICKGINNIKNTLVQMGWIFKEVTRPAWV